MIGACHFALIYRIRNGQAFAATQRADDLRKFHVLRGATSRAVGDADPAVSSKSPTE